MKAFLNKILRPCKKWTDILPIAAVATFLLVLIGQVLGEVLMDKLGLINAITALTGNEDTAVFLAMYASFITIWLVIVLVMAVFKANRPMLRAIHHNRRGNTFGWGLKGFLIGFGLNGLCILLSALMGDIKLVFSGIDPLLLLLFLIAVTIQSGAEELATRIYLYEKLRRRYRHAVTAIVANALLFGAMHLANPDVSVLAIVQIVLIGVLLSLMIYYYGSFWCAVMIHTGWNFTQSILFGLPNSGIVSAYSVFRLDAASARNGLFYNVGFGVEGSLGSCIVIALGCVLVLILGSKRKGREDLWQEAEAQAITAKAAPQELD